jgi:hypothetical protein
MTMNCTLPAAPTPASDAGPAEDAAAAGIDQLGPAGAPPLVSLALAQAPPAPADLVPLLEAPADEPTLEPWRFVRNLRGAMMLGGLIVLVVARRQARTRMGLPHRPRAAVFAALLGVVLATGFLLEAHKIASPRAFASIARVSAPTRRAPGGMTTPHAAPSESTRISSTVPAKTSMFAIAAICRWTSAR